MTRELALLTVLAFAVTTGCARARLSLSARSAHIPLSLSEGFFDGGTLVLRERYEVVHHFHFDRDFVAFNGLVPAKTVDIGDELQAVATGHSGDAIVNLRVVGRDRGGWSLLTFLLTMCTGGLVAPTYVGATVEGDVARLLPDTPAPPANAPAGGEGNHNPPSPPS